MNANTYTDVGIKYVVISWTVWVFICMGVRQLVQVLIECESLRNVCGISARQDFMSFGATTDASACCKLKSVRFNLNSLRSFPGL